MALINCPECEKEVSEKANECPNCHAPLTKTSASEVIHFIAGIILILAFGWGILGLSNIYFGWENNATFNFILVMTNSLIFLGPSAFIFLIGALLFKRS